jgi:hypothetical protein
VCTVLYQPAGSLWGRLAKPVAYQARGLFFDLYLICHAVYGNAVKVDQADRNAGG